MSTSKSRFLTALWGLPGLLTLLTLGLDQLTKWIVCQVWPTPGANAQYVVIDGIFRLVHWRNPGAAWGMFGGATWLLACVSLVASLAIIICFRKLTEDKAIMALPLGILLGGILGNFIDRAFFEGGVVDFISVGWWPAFNVADSAICCTMVFMVVVTLKETWCKGKKHHHANENE